MQRLSARTSGNLRIKLLMRWQWRREARVVEPRRAVNAKALELETAKEILAEVFKVRISDVDEMIQNRFEAAGNDDMVSKENGLWPQEFWLVE